MYNTPIAHLVAYVRTLEPLGRCFTVTVDTAGSDFIWSQIAESVEDQLVQQQSHQWHVYDEHQLSRQVSTSTEGYWSLPWSIYKLQSVPPKSGSTSSGPTLRLTAHEMGPQGMTVKALKSGAKVPNPYESGDLANHPLIFIGSSLYSSCT